MLSDHTLTIGAYQFSIRTHSANVASRMQRDIFYRVTDADKWRFVRSVYFDDIVPAVIQAFCEHFADDAEYRRASLHRTTDWARCNDLFLRNCFNPYFQPNPVLTALGSLVRAYYFFQEHTPAIMALPDYQRFTQQDNAMVPHPHQPDPAIVDLIRACNQLDGVRTLASCQGVSGTVRYAGYDLLTLSPHARYAYIWFAHLSPMLEQPLQRTTFSATIYDDTIYPVLQSRGDNRASIAEMTTFIASVLH
ncbi:MAG: hypothetical protein ACFE0Q_15830 [Anaerolineae bacterium]